MNTMDSEGTSKHPHAGTEVQGLGVLRRLTHQAQGQ